MYAPAWSSARGRPSRTSAMDFAPWQSAGEASCRFASCANIFVRLSRNRDPSSNVIFSRSIHCAIFPVVWDRVVSRIWPRTVAGRSVCTSLRSSMLSIISNHFVFFLNQDRTTSVTLCCSFRLSMVARVAISESIFSRVSPRTQRMTSYSLW